MPVSSVGSYYEYSVKSETTSSNDMDKDTFLNLMVTQLKYQDPLEPMDNTEYVAQLAQFSSLEQLQNVNNNLSDNAYLTQSMHNSIVSSLIGKDILAQSNVVNWSGSGETELNFTLEDEADVTVSIYTENGDLLKTIDLGHQAAGTQSTTWDGTNFMDGIVNEGTYYMDVVASDEDGNSISAVPLFRGTVTGLKYNDGNPILMVGNAKVSISEIMEIVAHESSNDEESESEL